MKSFLMLLKSELKLNIRDVSMAIFAVIMSLTVLAILSFVYGTKPAVEGTAYTFMERSFGALYCISVCTGGLIGLPLVVSEYRERGTLKRSQVTPVDPTKLLTVEFIIYMIYCVVSILTLFPVTMLFWKVKVYGSFLLFLRGWFLTMISALSIGLLVGGIAKDMKSASVIACTLYFPMPIFSGATLPFEVIPSAMQKIIKIFPLTRGIQLMEATFLRLSADSALLPVVVMCAVTITCFGISVKYFKWEQEYTYN